jgi:hypothetical protein
MGVQIPQPGDQIRPMGGGPAQRHIAPPARDRGVVP